MAEFDLQFETRTARRPRLLQPSIQLQESRYGEGRGSPESRWTTSPSCGAAHPRAGFTPQPSPEQQTARPSKPINWEELINNAPEAEAPKPAEVAPVATAPAPEAPPAQPQAMPQADVDAETRAILEKAAKDLQDKLLGQGGNEDA